MSATVAPLVEPDPFGTRRAADLEQHRRDRLRRLEQRVDALEVHRAAVEELLAAVCILAGRTLNRDPADVLATAEAWLANEKHLITELAAAVTSELAREATP